MDKAVNQPWTIAQRFTFRFFSLYFLIYLATPITAWAWDPIVLKAGQWMGVWKDIIEYPNGSGDTTYNYVQVVCMLMLAAICAIVWWIVDHKRKSYYTLFYWWMVLLRYGLAFYMITYGFSKLFIQQFPFPTLRTLIEPYGDSTPMRLAWTFMGYSPAFSIFTGLAEIIGGCLLLWRRTTMFGSLFCMTVLANVVAINFCYDVPVKLFSTHLLLMAFFICVPYLPRLLRFFWQHKEIPAFAQRTIYHTKGQHITHITLKALAIAAMLGMQVGYMMEDDDELSPLYGLYVVDEYVHNRNVLPPLTTDSTRWQYLTIDIYNMSYVQNMTGKGLGYYNKIDTVKYTITLDGSWDEKESVSFNYTKPDPTHLQLWRTDSTDTVHIKFHKKDMKEFRLVSTGFNWVNEFPNNK